MREIELELGMQKGLRIQGIDNWGKLKDAERERLKALGLENWCRKQREGRDYELPSGKKHYKWIFGALFILWTIILALAVLLILMACLNPYV